MVQSVQPTPVWQARPSGPTPPIRETLDAIDATETAILRGQDDLDATRVRIKKGIGAIFGGLMLGGGWGTVLAMTAPAGVAPLACLAGVIVIAGAVVAGHGPSELKQAKKALLESEQKRGELQKKLEEQCASERKDNEQSLLRAGRDGMATMRHIASDPYVAVAAERFAHSSKVVSRDRSLLEMNRQDRFAAGMPRSQEIFSEKADALGLFGLLGLVGTLYAGMAVGATINSAIPMLVGIAGAAGGWFGIRYQGRKLVAPSVDRQLTKEITAELQLHEPRLAALREAEEKSNESALEHYHQLLVSTPHAAPGTVKVEDQQVVIGGVTVPRSSEE